MEPVLATPELVLLVCDYLPAPDLARCSLVCKAWSRQFEPILWAHFCPKNRDAESSTDAPVVTAGLMRNLPHIRTLNLSVVDRTALQALISPFDLADQDQSMLCTNLRRLKFGDAHYTPFDSIALHLAALLNHNQLLTHLELSYAFLANSVVLASISGSRHLQHITITSRMNRARCRETLLFLKACLHLPDLTELRFIDVDLNWDEVDRNKEKDMPDAETIIKEASITRFSRNPTATNIRFLRLPGSFVGTRNPLPFLLLKSDLLDLRSCEIPLFRKDADLKEIEQVVREHCPNLKHLIHPSLRGGMNKGAQAVCAFIRGCSGLEKFTGELFCDYDTNSFDLTYFNNGNSGIYMRRILQEVGSCHYKTLKVLDLTYCFQVYSDDQQYILSQCRQLKRFWVTDTYGSMAGIASTDISSSDWVCSELQELGLVLNLRPKKENKFDILKDGTKEDGGWDAYDIEELVVKATKQVYTQIGRMEKLEVLALDLDRSSGRSLKITDFASNLTVRDGWLSELAGLKELESLQLGADFWSAMGQAEVEFMYENWPRLIEITFKRTPFELAQLKAHSHWQWLLHRRPQLRLLS